MNIFSNIEKFTVSQLNNSIKNLIEKKFHVITVVGEISQVKKHSSGHIYFTLKDEESSVSAICWRSVVPSLNLDVEEGIKAVIQGKVTTYPQQSKYQLIVQQLEFEGEGNLLKILELRKKKFAELGFFDEAKKRNIPKYPNSIGVITSQSGAVIKDIIHRISDRFPIELVIYPANVQGSKCLSDLINGIEYFNSQKNKDKVDTIIIARGGGSLEDLMSFNEELLVHKIFKSIIPVVSAVGHETDFTLCDLVSDLRAPTPSAAAEMIVPERKQIISRLMDLENLLKKLYDNNFNSKVMNLKLLISKIPDLTEIVNNNFQELDYFEQDLKNLLNTNLKNIKIKLYELTESFSPNKLENLIKILLSKLSSRFEKICYITDRNVKDKNQRLKSKSRELSILSYKQTLNRGFAVVRRDNKIVKNDLEIKKNQEIEIEFSSTKTLAKKI